MIKNLSIMAVAVVLTAFLIYTISVWRTISLPYAAALEAIFIAGYIAVSITIAERIWKDEADMET